MYGGWMSSVQNVSRIGRVVGCLWIVIFLIHPTQFRNSPYFPYFQLLKVPSYTLLTTDLSKLNIKLFLLILASKALLRDWTFSPCNPLGWNSPESSQRNLFWYFDQPDISDAVQIVKFACKDPYIRDQNQYIIKSSTLSYHQTFLHRSAEKIATIAG